VAELELRIWTLQNGAKVAFRPALTGSNEVLLRAVSPGGRAMASPAQYDSARLATSVVQDSGLGDHDIGASFRLLEGKRANAEPWVSHEFEGIRGGAPIAELELLLQLVHLYITAPRGVPAALERYRASLRAPLDPSRAFARAITAALYPGNPRLDKPNPDALDLDEMMRFYRDRFGNVSDFTFVIVADMAEEPLQALVERYLANLPGSPRPDGFPTLKDERRAGITRVQVPGRAGRDSAVKLEFYGPAQPSATARMALESLATYLEGALRDVLRRERGAVYELSVTFDLSTAGYTLTIAFNCLPADVHALQEATWQVIGQVARGEVSDQAIDELKASLRERYGKAMNANRFWVDQLEQAYLLGTAPQDILTLPELSTRITRASLAEAARQYLSSDQYLDAVWSPASGAK
jgi:zinc protease